MDTASAPLLACQINDFGVTTTSHLNGFVSLSLLDIKRKGEAHDKVHFFLFFACWFLLLHERIEIERMASNKEDSLTCCFSMENHSSTPNATTLRRRSSLKPSLNQISPSLSISNMKAEYSLQALVENAPHEPLPYHIYDHSSFSGPYHPRNICVNDPTEQSSRWSSNSHDQSQYVTIKLEKPAVACKYDMTP